jgi:hypothetical protein
MELAIAPLLHRPLRPEGNLDPLRDDLALQIEASALDLLDPACYLSSEGVVRVPERICRVLGLPQGGGVVFLEREGASAEMISDATFADRFEPKAEHEGDDDA